MPRKTKKRFLIALIIFSILLIFFIISINTSLWRYLPDNMRVRVAVMKLDGLYMENIVCHEDCFYEEQLYQKMVENSLVAGHRSTCDLLEEVITNPRNSINLKKSLVEVLGRLNLEETPEYLLELNMEDSGVFTQREIVERAISEDRLGSVLPKIIAEIESEQTSLDDRKELLTILMDIEDDSLYPFHFELLKTNHGRTIKRVVLRNLSNLNDVEKLAKLGIVEFLRSDIFSEDVDRYTKASEVRLLSNFLSSNKKEVSAIYRDIYYSQEIDNFTKLFTVNISNRELDAQYEEPEISTEEWADYNKNDQWL